MKGDIDQLLALRRRREQQAASQLQRILARRDDKAGTLARLRTEQASLRRTVARRITALYEGSVGRRLPPSGLDGLVTAVDQQYRLEAEHQAAVADAEAELAAVAAEAETARQQLLERSRAVEKLALLAEDLRTKAGRAAEALAEDEAERPAAGRSLALPAAGGAP